MKIIHDEKGKQFLCIHGDGRIGYLSYVLPDDDSGSRNVQIDWFYIDPQCRGKGYGKSLMEAFLQYARTRFLWVSFWTGKEIEEMGKADYYKQWFVESAWMPDYYDVGIATRLFVLKLKCA